ncbi:polyamine-transporting ATPase 13A3-like isoform X1 [Diorhabda carinulata]|uniref:polyamine-transporting ATPase 13A3-like isoform X1 n=1 Tax=Diorhabda carinulata TaxID=1163345 RepID=UPI0025A102E9|nr:polyamine-transporting ATPase 13A3-like isoform X1 [Diorhabda carinulata]
MKKCQAYDAHVRNKSKYQSNGTSLNKESTRYLNYGNEDQMGIEGFVHSNLKSNFFLMLYILTVGTLRIFFHWYPNLYIKATHTRSSLRYAERVLITDVYKKFKTFFIKDVKIVEANEEGSTANQKQENILECNLCDGRQKRLTRARIIRLKKLLYVWDDETENFVKLAGFDTGVTRAQLHSLKGQSKEKQEVKRLLYGDNEISVPVQSILTLLALEALTPFYMFQLFSLIVWLCESYYYYTGAIFVMSAFGISTSIIQTRKNQRNLKGTVNLVDKTLVCRGNGVFAEIPTTELVPGDLIAIPPGGCDMQCDAVLITGNCVVNESMLTGESVPITKTPLANDSMAFQLKDNVNHILFNGTKIIQTRSNHNEKVFAVVIRTGYLTTKGELVRSILYPPPADFKFDTDSYKFIGILFAIATLGVIYTVVSKSTRQIETTDILIKALDIFTIAVPPALPAAMTVGKLYALNRLKHKQIFCINSRVINVSGSIDCVCFDKTGTLTEDELDMWGVVPVENNEVKPALRDVKQLNKASALFKGMATCHSLSVIKEQLGGDPLDIKMFEATGWVIGESMDDRKHNHIVVRPNIAYSEKGIAVQLEIIKQFQFISQLQRMSVIAFSTHHDQYSVFCKGSPEMIMTLSKPSTLPKNLMDEVQKYTVQGYRVIAVATKNLTISSPDTVNKIAREEVECDLEFSGLIILENKLKPETSGIIDTLIKANLKVVMITGDNLQTGVHVAKECGMVEPNQHIIEIITEEPTDQQLATISYKIISEADITKQFKTRSDIEKYQPRNYCFAVTGKSWGNVVTYFPELIPKIVTKGVIFARMSGMQKQQLVEELKTIGYYVAMCGDGANDCGALKAAHVGISLSEAESSVASPFTSKIQNISCVPKVIKEGRAALVTSFGIFKVMLCYSLIEFTSVMILYNIDANLTAFEFLYIDIFLILNFASLFGMTKANKVLYKSAPENSLVGFIPISSIACYLILCAVFQIFAYYWIQTYSWFSAFVYVKSSVQDYTSYENYAVFTVSMFQYITMCFVFSKGSPYRRPLYTNIPFTLSLLVTCAVCVWMTLIPFDWVRDIMDLEDTPIEGAVAMIVIAAVNFVVSIIFEDVLVECLLGKIIVPKFRSIHRSHKKYLVVLSDLNRDSSWPNVNYKETTVYNSGEITNGINNRGYVDDETR